MTWNERASGIVQIFINNAGEGKKEGLSAYFLKVSLSPRSSRSVGMLRPEEERQGAHATNLHVRSYRVSPS